jgi:hypothetical protein
MRMCALQLSDAMGANSNTGAGTFQARQQRSTSSSNNYTFSTCHKVERDSPTL